VKGLDGHAFEIMWSPNQKNTDQGNSSKPDLSPPSETFRVAGIIQKQFFVYRL